MITRQKFEFPVGKRGDTGAPANGVLHQIRWLLGSDTGQNVTVSVLPKQGDTGEGYVVYSKVNGFDAIVTPGLFGHDTGSGSSFVQYSLASERIRVKITNDTGVATPNASGTLYAWFKQ